MFSIYDTLSKKFNKFHFLRNKKIKIYLCGVTVYSDCHIGHARTFIIFDTLFKYLKLNDFKIFFIRNITDIDDKIIEKSLVEKTSIKNISKKFIKSMKDDFCKLQIDKVSYEPAVTDFIFEIIFFIQKLFDIGYAYIGDNGDVFYDIMNNHNYGSISGIKINKNFNIENKINLSKRCYLDFVLWKKSKKNSDFWFSPWGFGRPGWHIECSAISIFFLGNFIDIHGGGIDLIFPHHENECAQSDVFVGEKNVLSWMHTGSLNINGKKMSKTLNNFILINKLLKYFNFEVIRFFSISAHYRSFIDYSYNKINNSFLSLKRLYTSMRYIPKIKFNIDDNFYKKRFFSFINNDFNTPSGISILFEIVSEINYFKSVSIIKSIKMVNLLKYLANFIGLLNQKCEDFFKNVSFLDINFNFKINYLVNRRNVARFNKNWYLSDKIRICLLKFSVVLEDNKYYTIWKIKI